MKSNRRNLIVISSLCLVISLFLPYLVIQAETIDFKRKEIIIVYEKDVSYEYMEELVSSFSVPVRITDNVENYALLEIEGPYSIDSVIHKLLLHNEILIAEPNYILSASTYNSNLNSQWNLNNSGSYISYYGPDKKIITSTEDADIDMPEALELYNSTITYPKEVIVAIIDTGVDYLHEELTQNMWKNPGEIAGDNIDNDGNGFIDDVYGWDFYNNDSSTVHYDTDNLTGSRIPNPKDNDDHGTHVAGIIAANSTNGLGIDGIVSTVNVKVMTLKVLGGSEEEGGGNGSTYDAIKAIKYATKMGAHIGNMSWGVGSLDSISMKALETVMKESDMLFVAAAGNESNNNDTTPMYPANFKIDNLISVGSADSNGTLSSYSNYGVNSVDIIAPGGDILSTVVGSYASLSGSSMSAPHVSGIAALIYSTKENLYATNVKEVLLNSYKPIKKLKGFISHPGIISAYHSLLAIDNLKIDSQAPTLTFKTSYVKDKIKIKVTSKDKGESNIRVIKYLKGTFNIPKFARGTNGISLTSTQLTLSKGGTYTFYISDYAGNETVYTYIVKPDVTPPKIKSHYTVSKDLKTKTISVNILDKRVDTKIIKYRKGVHTPKNFLSKNSGKKLTLKDKKTQFRVTTNGKYTIYAEDYFGNKIVKVINVK